MRRFWRVGLALWTFGTRRGAIYIVLSRWAKCAGVVRSDRLILELSQLTCFTHETVVRCVIARSANLARILTRRIELLVFPDFTDGAWRAAVRRIWALAADLTAHARMSAVLILVFAENARRASSRLACKIFARSAKLARILNRRIELLVFPDFADGAWRAAIRRILALAADLTAHARMCAVLILVLAENTRRASSRVACKFFARSAKLA